MFITQVADRWFFTTQSDHSNLVGQIAAMWGNSDFDRPEPLRSMILAAAEHDHVWVREDHQGILKHDGVPYDFANLPYDRHTSLYAEGARQVGSRDSYAGLMVSLHGMGIYNMRHGTDQTMIRRRTTARDEKIIDDYIDREECYQSVLKSDLKSSHAEYLEDESFWTNYHLLQVWDRLGILLSKYEQGDFVIEPTPTNYSGGRTRLEFKWSGDFRYTVDPYPFALPEVSFCFLARWLDRIKFENDETYRRCLDLTPRVAVNYTFAPIKA
ncbi:DUF3891 family protein [Pelagicoccus albus]|uniref:DUF3891 family protein n=1 Tax=Pelagicoccus albus TaxID=415222 RepID=A0A7X1E712_9BACT|nr:DUF3891 family protein [Pelagicoccus albus]MBC2604701.1 DUF3891 family protein [Pelagicoccus albus]